MAATASMFPPEGLLEIVFSFDTNCFMSPVLEEVKERIQDMIQRLQADIPGIRIGIIARGSFFDKNNLTKELDLCTDIEKLCSFMKGVKATYGEDGHELNELILRKVIDNFSWTFGSGKVLVMIGDVSPYQPNFGLNVENINWKTEIDCFSNKGVKIYGIKVLENIGAVDFYKAMAINTGGQYLKLGEFSNICDFLMAICYRERSAILFSGYETEVRGQYGPDGMPKHLEGMFRTLMRKNSPRNDINAIPIADTDSTYPSQIPSSPGYILPSAAFSKSSLDILPSSPISSQSSYLPASPDHLPSSPVNNKSSPIHLTPSPVNSEASPDYLPSSPVYSESPSVNSPLSPVYSEFSNCSSPNYSPSLIFDSPLSPSYSLSSGYFSSPSSSPTYSI